MSNTFITTDLVVRDAAIILSDNLVMANLINRNHEAEFAKKVGDTIEVKVPPIQTARDFIDDSSSTTANDVTEVGVDVVLERHPYVKHDFTSGEQSLELDDFNEVVTKPAILGIRDAIDSYLLSKAAGGFARNLVGTPGTEPATIADIVAGRKVLQDNGCPQPLRRSVVGTVAEAAFLQLDQFTNSSYGDDAPGGLKEAQLGRRYGIDFYADQNSGDFDQGDKAGTVLVDGGSQTGTTLDLKDFTAATGTLKAGARFTIAGLSNTYTTILDATCVANDCTVTLDQALESSPAGDAAITFEAAFSEDMIFHRDAMAGAIVAPEGILGMQSSVAVFDGVAIRVSMDGSLSTLSSSIVFDTFLGGQVIQPDAGVIYQS